MSHPPESQIELLKAQATAQLLILNAQKERMQTCNETITKAVQHYNATKSLFGQVAYWYGEQQW
ncbi:MAG TPA: hypothetical protein VHD33_08505, partial [Legionellaceae bacterium]|nr:hypothetical protein [Legionellaceae bacterium]